MKILMCASGEKWCEVAARLTGKIANFLGAEVTVIYVRPKLFTSFSRSYSIEGKSLEHEQEIMEHTSWILKKEGAQDVRTIKRVGEPAREILRESEKGYNMIVCGTRGLKGIKRFLFGSVSGEVAEYGKVPVLVIRKNVDVQKILVCTDGSAHAEEAEFCAGALAKGLGADVAVLSVAPHEKAIEEFFEKAVEKGRALIKNVFGIDAESKLVVGESISKEVLKEAAHHDLVVLGSRGLSKIKRLLMGHVSLKVLHHADTNVLIVRNCEMYRKWKREHAYNGKNGKNSSNSPS